MFYIKRNNRNEGSSGILLQVIRTTPYEKKQFYV